MRASFLIFTLILMVSAYAHKIEQKEKKEAKTFEHNSKQPESDLSNTENRQSAVVREAGTGLKHATYDTGEQTGNTSKTSKKADTRKSARGIKIKKRME